MTMSNLIDKFLSHKNLTDEMIYGIHVFLDELSHEFEIQAFYTLMRYAKKNQLTKIENEMNL